MTQEICVHFIYFPLILVDCMHHNYMAICLDDHFPFWYVFVFLIMFFFKSNETDKESQNQAGFYHLVPFMEYKSIELCGNVCYNYTKFVLKCANFMTSALA